MRLKPDYIRYSLQNVIHKKLRSWLTVISILIGIMAIYALISFGQGLGTYIDSISAEMGTDKLIVQPKGVGAPGSDDNFWISKEDLDFVSKVKGVSEVAGMYAKGLEVEFHSKKSYTILIGLPTDKASKRLMDEVLYLDIVEGRGLETGDKLKAVLGYNYRLPDKIFTKPVNLGDNILLNGMKFKVIGFYEEVGNPQDDSQAYVSFDGFEELYPDRKDKYATAMIRADANEDTRELADKVKEKLRKFKGQDEGKEDFFVQSFEQALETFTNILDIVNGVLVLIALISLVVAGVNIMNTMYTAVLERTQEIGIMKSVGARNSDILSIFLFESGFLGMVGGVFGIILGYIIASAGGSIAAASGYSILKPEFPLWLTIGCVMFAFLVGALSGLLPAIQASKLKPVDALRYE